MSSRANRARWIVLAIVALVGCQSGPRWAWWKHDTTPENASLVARSAAPALPSTQSVPQSLAAASTSPATANTIIGAAPPSANSMAAALGTPPASISIPQTSPAAIPGLSASTIPAYSPVATTGYPMPGATPRPPSAAASPVAGPPATAAATMPMTASPIAAAGPYDPNAYRPASATTAAASPTVSLTGDGSTDADRYGALTPSSSTGSEPDRYSMVPDAPLTAGAPPNQNMSGSDRYSMGQQIGGQQTPASVSPSASPAASAVPAASANIAAASADPDRYGAMSSSAASSAPASPSAAATVRITSPAGQYRPGGTSTFTGLPASGVEIASRPNSGSPPAAAQAAPAPTGTSTIPSSPSGSDAGIKTY